MSTKTSFKRIALVAASALAIAGFSAVPASAAVTAGNLSGSDTTLYVAAGTEITTPVVVTSTTGAATSATSITITPTVSGPTGSAIAVGEPGVEKVGIDTPVATTTTALAATINLYTNTVSAGVQTLAWSSGTAPAIASAETVGTLRFKSATSGRYVVTLTIAGAGTATNSTIVVYVNGANGTVGTAGTGSKALTATVGGQAAFKYTTPNGTATGTIYQIQSSGVGSIVGATGLLTDNSTAENPVPYNGTAGDFSAGAKWTTATNTTSHVGTFTLQSTTAGTQTVSITKIDPATGAPTAVTSVTVTWNSGTSLNLTTLQVSVLPGDDAANCTIANKANAAHGTVTQVPATDQTNSAAADADLCVLAINGSGTAITLSSLSVAAAGSGLIANDVITNTTWGLASVSTDLDGVAQFNLAGSLIPGKGTYTVSAKALNADGTTYTTLTGTASVNFTDSAVLTATITQSVYALDADAAATTVATFKLLDKNAFAISSGSTGTGNLLVDSDNAATVTIDTQAETDALATAVTVSTATSVTSAGVVTAGIIQVDCAAAKYEKMTIWLGYGTSTVFSNKIVVYCSESAAHTFVLGAAGASVGEQQSVTATATAGITGHLDYPVADATTATFSTTQGTLSSTTAVAFENGVATVKFNAPLIGGPVTITALPSAVSATSVITITAGVSSTITIEGDSTASLALDAANAATDAANNAYDEAQNATQAASDALAAVTALAAQVKSLIAMVKKLTAAVAKLK